jgi:HEAT repeat protein
MEKGKWKMVNGRKQDEPDAFQPLLLLFTLFISLFPVLVFAAAPTTLPTVYGPAGIDYPLGIFANKTTPRTAQLLGEALKQSRTTADKAHYLAELGQTRLKQAGEYIKPFLSDPDPSLRAVAVVSAGRTGDTSLIGKVDDLLKDQCPEVRRAAIGAAVELAPDAKAKSEVVGRMLGDDQPTVAIEAMRLAEPANAAVIAESLLRWDPLRQTEGLRTLGRLKADAQASAVAPFLKSKDLVMQAAAISALGDMNVRAQADAILSFLNNPEPTLRRTAVLAMGQLADPAVQQKRAKAILENDPDPSVRQAACGMFAAHPLPSAVDVLVKQLYDPYLPLHDAARKALSHSASDAMTQQIIASAVKLLHESNLRRKEDGSYLLGQYRSKAAFDDHLALIHAMPGKDVLVDWDLYTQATRSLGRIGDAKAGPPLIPLLKKAPITMGELMNLTVSLDAEEAALVAVGQMKFTEALPQVWRIIDGSPQEEPANMRAASIWALGMLTPPDDAKTNQALIKIIEDSASNPPPSRFEACKALARRHAVSAADALKHVSQTDTDPLARFAAYQAYREITGQDLQYSPPHLPWTAQTSITDLAADQ